MPDETPETPREYSQFEPVERPPVVEPPARLPIRAVKRKANELRTEATSGRKMDPVIIYMRYVDLWLELRLGMSRAKRAIKVKTKRLNEKTGQLEQVYMPDEALFLKYIDAMRALLTDMVKLRVIIQDEGVGIPRILMDKIALALKAYPEAREALIGTLSEER